MLLILLQPDFGTFLVFGLGFGLPLVVLSLLAGTRSREIVGWIVAHHRAVEIVAGLLLIVVAIVDLADNLPFYEYNIRNKIRSVKAAASSGWSLSTAASQR